MRRFAALSLAFALGVGAALGLTSCGGGEDAKLLPGNTAAEITENLDRVKQYAEERECVGAEDAVAEVNNQIEGLTDVDSKLVEALQHGADRLEEVVAGCEEEETEAVSPSSEAQSTEEEKEAEEKIPPGQEKKAEREREKEEAAREREEEQEERHSEPPPAEPQPHEPPTPPGQGGGTGAPGGVSPGEPVEGKQGGD